MEEILADLGRLYSELGSSSQDILLIGGLAVRAHVGESARVTGDIDLVAMTPEARAALDAALHVLGYVVGVMGPWSRASPCDGSRRFIDIIGHPVVDVRTFDAVTLRGVPQSVDLGGVRVEVAAVSDLAVLKLMAARDQDLVDLLLLAHRCPLSAAEVAASAALDDVERRVSAGAIRTRSELASGALVATAGEALGRTPPQDAVVALERLLTDLEQEGL